MISLGGRPAARGEPGRRQIGVDAPPPAAVVGDHVAAEATARHDLLELSPERVVEPGVDERVVHGRTHGDQMRHEED